MLHGNPSIRGRTLHLTIGPVVGQTYQLKETWYKVYEFDVDVLLPRMKAESTQNCQE